MKLSRLAIGARSQLPIWFVFVLALCCSGAAAAAHGPIVPTRDGFIQGTSAASMLEFLGIPYAAPPVGNLRWQVPQPVQPWWGIREATAYGPHCPQNASAFGVATQTEDCLYLNVYVPAGRADWRSWEGLPVMFWIHGGSLDVGESDDYVPTALVSRGVVVVTINYRLGLLGYLVHQALAFNANGEGPFVNYGIRDQQAALAWVRDNIRFFGGDPHNVTVFGESAGGLSTFVQIVSPLATDLIHKAIVESGSYSLAIGSFAQNEAAGAAIATELGCSDQSAACLRALPVATLLAADAGIYYPTVDGKVLPQSIGPALASGQFNRVPVMQGTNHDEWRLFVALDFDLAGAPLTAPGFTYLMDATFGPAFGTAVLAEYPLANYPSPDLAYGAVGTDYIFACPSEIADQAMAQYVPVFAYEFSDPNAPELFLPPVSFSYGAAHASELQYLFSLPRLGGPGLTSAQQALSATMVDYWTGFARDSNPNRRGAPYWPTYEASSGVRQSFIPSAVMPEYDFSAFHQCSFWIPALEATGE